MVSVEEMYVKIVELDEYYQSAFGSVHLPCSLQKLQLNKEVDQAKMYGKSEKATAVDATNQANLSYQLINQKIF